MRTAVCVIYIQSRAGMRSLRRSTWTSRLHYTRKSVRMCSVFLLSEYIECLLYDNIAMSLTENKGRETEEHDTDARWLLESALPMSMSHHNVRSILGLIESCRS